MSLEFLKIHYLQFPFGNPTRPQTACGRLAPDWARRTTQDEDFVTCENCLDVLVARALLACGFSRTLSRENLKAWGHIADKGRYG